MAGLAIGEIAWRAGVRASTVRYYEDIALLPPPQRESGQRRYDATVLDRLGVIRLAQEAGLTLAEIRRLLHGFGADAPPNVRWQAVADVKIAELDAVIARAEHMKRVLDATRSCACSTLNECGRNSSSNAGRVPGR